MYEIDVNLTYFEGFISAYADVDNDYLYNI